MARRVTLDFETRSQADLKKVGAWAYSEHPSTQIICASWAVDRQPVRSWINPAVCGVVPAKYANVDELVALLEDETVEVEAHHAPFEYSIIHNAAARSLGWPTVGATRWRDTMAVACYYALPPALDALCRVLGLPGKDPAGDRLIQRYSKLHLKTAHKDIPLEDAVAFSRYCARDTDQEREVSFLLGDLPEAEQAVFLHDFQVTIRGLLLDRPGIRQAAGVVEARQSDLAKKFLALTGFNPTQRDRIMEWLEREGVKLPALAKDDIDEALEGPLPKKAREAMQLRREYARTSTTKLDTMLRQAGSNGRARFQTRYHGAVTGRNTGSGFQPLNLVRSWEGVDSDQLVRDISYGDARFLDAVYGDAMEAVSKALRHYIKADKGSRIIAGDFSSVEAVILACLAQEEWKVQAFRDHEPIYELGACSIYQWPRERAYDPDFKKKWESERQDGKTRELACLAGDTPVLTDSGWKPIVTVALNDLVWDGVSWQQHEGLVTRGMRLVGPLGLTEDHLVWGGHVWNTARTVDMCDKLLRRSVETALGSLPWSVSNGGRAAASTQYGSDAIANRVNISLARVICGKVVQPDATDALREKVSERESNTGATRMCALMTSIGAGFLIGSRLALLAAGPAGTRITEREAFEYTEHGAAEPQDAGPFSRILSRCRAGISRACNWTGWTLTEAMNQAICGFRNRVPVKSARWRSLSAKSGSLKPVYDLANAGPRNRFTIWTSAGPLIVHNCGYQGALGAWRKFDKSDRHTDEAVVAMVRSWREDHPKTVSLWRAMDDGAIRAISRPRGGPVHIDVGPSGAEAVQRRQPIPVGSFGFEMVDNWLTMVLPDGKRLWYWHPSIVLAMSPWHDPENDDDCSTGKCTCLPGLKVSYWARKEGKWRRVYSYGGKWVENLVQATSRQLLKPCEMALDAAGYPVILSVYDEVVSEVLEGFGSPEEFQEIVDRTLRGLTWAQDWPIRMPKPWEGSRYRK